MTPAPKTLIPPDSLDVRFYRMFKYNQHCTGCNANHDHSEIFACYPIRAGYGMAPVIRPIDVQWNLPVEIQSGPVRVTPFCHDCWRPGMLNHLPKPPPPKRIVASVQEPEKSKPAKTPKATKTSSADDLDWS